MLSDEQIIPICKSIARRFVSQAKHLGPPDEAFNELVNVAYCAAKPRNSLKGVSTWIVWVLIHYVTHPDGSLRKRLRAKGSYRDLRKLYNQSEQPSPTDLLIQKEEREALIHSISKLSQWEMRIIYAYYRDNKTYPQIGESFGKSREWIRMQLKRIIQKLREEMEK